LRVNPTPAVTITPDKPNPVPVHKIVHLVAEGGTGYAWDPAPGILHGKYSAHLSIMPQQDTNYVVRVTGSNGCTALRSYSMQVESNDALKFDNILTPNGDGINDKWTVHHAGRYGNNELRIFDRSGGMVYQKKNYTDQWDGMVNGKPLHNGTYYYVFIINDGEKIYKGYIELIRGRRGSGK
jgi:gliding motility-associated-like protein